MPENQFIYVTYFDSKYVVRGLTMIESVNAYKELRKVKWIVLALDEESYRSASEFLTAEDDLIRIEQFDDSELLSLRESRPYREFCWTIAACLINYAIKSTGFGGIVTYVEPENKFEGIESIVEETYIEEPVAKTKPQPMLPKWEIKDRTYILSGPHSPLTYTIASRHTGRFPLLWFDKDTGEQKELRYATNQNSVFTEDQKGEATLGHIIFKNGTLTVPKEKQNLQKLLSLYHPDLNKKYKEFDPVINATDDLEDMDIQLDAMNAARDMDIDEAEAILRVEIGSKVSKMTSKEIKRD